MVPRVLPPISPSVELAAPPPPAQPPTISVGQATRRLAKQVPKIFGSKPVWVEGQLSGLEREASRGGHKFFTLVERASDSGQVTARLNAVMFNADRERINNKIRAVGVSGAIKDDATVRVLGWFSFYEPNGAVNFKVTDLDAASLRANLLVGRDQTLRLLRSEGVAGLNKAKVVPAVPLRIGLVTSLGSAAHHDVEKSLGQSGFAITMVTSDTAVQGRGAPDLIANAIARASKADVDVLLVCRGGGSDLDLSVFDDMKVARAVACCAVPVFTGVGHEIDEPVVDSVAHSAFATPTAAAEEIVKRLTQCSNDIASVVSALQTAAAAAIAAIQHERMAAWTDMGHAAQARLWALEAQRLDIDENLRAAAHGSLVAHKSEHANTAATLERVVRNAFEQRSNEFSSAHDLIEAFDPQVRLDQGWSITRLADGRATNSHRDAEPGVALHTHLRDGFIVSRVEHTTPTKAQ